MMRFQLIDDLRRLARSHGLLGVLRLFFWYYIYHERSEALLSLDMDEFRKRQRAERSGYRFVIVDSTDHPAFAALARLHPNCETRFRRKLEAGHYMTCLLDGSADKDEIVGYCIAALSEYTDECYPGVTFPVGPNEAYAFSLFVVQSARSRSAARVLVNEYLIWLRSRGVTRVFALCASDQPALLRFYRTFGSTATGRGVTHRKLFRFRWTSWTSEPRSLDALIAATSNARHGPLAAERDRREQKLQETAASLSVKSGA